MPRGRFRPFAGGFASGAGRSARRARPGQPLRHTHAPFEHIQEEGPALEVEAGGGRTPGARRAPGHCQAQRWYQRPCAAYDSGWVDLEG